MAVRFRSGLVLSDIAKWGWMESVETFLEGGERFCSRAWATIHCRMERLGFNTTPLLNIKSLEGTKEQNNKESFLDGVASQNLRLLLVMHK